VTTRDRIVILVVAAVAGLAGFYFLALKPKRDEAAKLGRQVSEARDRLDQARSDLAASQAARSTFAANYATVARLGKAVPTDDDVPALVYQLDTTARASGVDFRSVKLTSGAGSPAPPAANAARGAAASSDQANAQRQGQGSQQNGQQGGQQNGQQGAPQGSAPAAPTQAATAALPPGAVVGPAGLSTMPFSFSFEGSFFRLSDFLARVERYVAARRRRMDVQGRLLLINGISLTAAHSGFPRMKAAISATAYLLPANQGLFNGATPQGPATPGPAQPAGATPASAVPGAPVAPATVAAP
jgi:hypothetical protein